MQEGYVSTPLIRSKMLKFSKKSMSDLLLEEQTEVYYKEISQERNKVLQANNYHEMKLKEIQDSYELKNNQQEKEFEARIQNLYDKLITLNHSLEQEKQARLSQSHLSASLSISHTENIKNLKEKHESSQKILNSLTKNELKSYSDEVNSLRAEYDTTTHTIRNEKRRCEEYTVEKSYHAKKKVEKREKKLKRLEGKKHELLRKLEEIERNNEKKMIVIQEELKGSIRVIERHEDKLENVKDRPVEGRVEELSKAIEICEENLEDERIENERLKDKLERLKKILYSKN